MTATHRTWSEWWRHWSLAFACLFFYTCAGSCFVWFAFGPWFFRYVTIEDVTVYNICELHASSDHPSTVMFHVVGHLDGEAEFFDDSQWHTLTGEVDLLLSRDYFQSTLLISYRPKNVTGGRLTIKYSLD